MKKSYKIVSNFENEIGKGNLVKTLVKKIDNDCGKKMRNSEKPTNEVSYGNSLCGLMYDNWPVPPVRTKL